MLMFIIGMSLLFSYVMSYLHISQSMAQWIVALHLSKWLLLTAILLLVVVLGFFLPPVSIILMTAPIILPPLKAAGFDLIWFGVLMTIVMEAGLIHPPVGLNLFVIKNIAPDITLGHDHLRRAALRRLDVRRGGPDLPRCRESRPAARRGDGRGASGVGLVLAACCDLEQPFGRHVQEDPGDAAPPGEVAHGVTEQRVVLDSRGERAGIDPRLRDPHRALAHPPQPPVAVDGAPPQRGPRRAPAAPARSRSHSPSHSWTAKTRSASGGGPDQGSNPWFRGPDAFAGGKDGHRRATQRQRLLSQRIATITARPASAGRFHYWRARVFGRRCQPARGGWNRCARCCRTVRTATPLPYATHLVACAPSRRARQTRVRRPDPRRNSRDGSLRLYQ